MTVFLLRYRVWPSNSKAKSRTLLNPSHVEATEEERKKLGIPETLIRCAVGIENIEDLIADFDQALSKIQN